MCATMCLIAYAMKVLTMNKYSTQNASVFSVALLRLSQNKIAFLQVLQVLVLSFTERQRQIRQLFNCCFFIRP